MSFCKILVTLWGGCRTLAVSFFGMIIARGRDQPSMHSLITRGGRGGPHSRPDFDGLINRSGEAKICETTHRVMNHSRMIKSCRILDHPRDFIKSRRIITRPRELDSVSPAYSRVMNFAELDQAASFVFCIAPPQSLRIIIQILLESPRVIENTAG